MCIVHIILHYAVVFVMLSNIKHCNVSIKEQLWLDGSQPKLNPADIRLSHCKSVFGQNCFGAPLHFRHGTRC